MTTAALAPPIVLELARLLGVALHPLRGPFHPREGVRVDLGDRHLLLVGDAEFCHNLGKASRRHNGLTLQMLALHVAGSLPGHRSKPVDVTRITNPAELGVPAGATTASTPEGSFMVHLSRSRKLADKAVRKVLVVHPDPGIRLSISNVLRATTIKVVGAVDSMARGMGIAALQGVDLVILDGAEVDQAHGNEPWSWLVLGGKRKPGIPRIDPPVATDLVGVRNWAEGELLSAIERRRNRDDRVSSPTRTVSVPIPIAQSRPSRVRPAFQQPTILAIAASTGGPEALSVLLAGLPLDFPLPIVVVQHMSGRFTAGFAARLNRMVPLEVQEARTGIRPKPGEIWLAPGGHHLSVGKDSQGYLLRLTDEPPEHGCKPAADVTFRSLEAVTPNHVLAVVLTGMGEDGGEGARSLYLEGSRVLVQDAETSVVWGMPGSVVRRKAADEVLPLNQMAKRIVYHARGGRS